MCPTLCIFIVVSLIVTIVDVEPSLFIITWLDLVLSLRPMALIRRVQLTRGGYPQVFLVGQILLPTHASLPVMSSQLAVSALFLDLS